MQEDDGGRYDHLTLREIREKLEFAMNLGSLPDWLDEAVARLTAHANMSSWQRIWDVSTVGARIRTAREIVGYNQKQLGARLGKVHQLQVSGWENGHNDLPARLLPRLCIALGVTEDWLLMNSDEGGPAIPERVQRKLKRVGWAEQTMKQKKRQWARCRAEELRGLRPPRPKEKPGKVPLAVALARAGK